ncbi:LysM peptidoglycan-binding domain-containing protein [Roseobacter sp. YSTF-M11]|uniref:LysM peptidoglycan-binding domain-containing protein n=1 Tax=Roseobacter insulae TaxID=2859783 RepID=A0A9X1FU64_9RHOB|nr:LysM peptidoglycan-binding domain-containing protein [Roseobacter insulae]MBW4707733.1 LysM peptidoglycan-binding domain-containing protein [Roseobacter insulae]
MHEDGAANKSGGTGLLTAGIVIALVIAAGTYMGLQDNTTPSQEELATVVAPDASVPAPDQQAAPAPAVPVPAAQTPQAASPAAPADETPGAAAGDDAADTADTSAAKTPEDLGGQTVAGIVPSVDEVRLEEDGLAVIAGRAEPGSRVSVLVDGVEIATAIADTRGAFAAVGVVAPSDKAQVLTLKAEGGNAVVASVDEIILAPLPVPTADAGGDTTGSDPDDTPRLAARTEDASGATVVAQAAEEPAAQSNTPVEDSNSEAAGARGEGNTTVAPDDTPAGVADAPVQQDTVVIAGAAAPDVETPPGDGGGGQVGATAEVPDGDAPSIQKTPDATEAAEPLQGADDTDTAALEASDAPGATATPEPRVPASQGVAVLKSTSEGVELLQPAQQEDTSNIAIDTIGYSDTGDVQLAGRAVAGTSEVRVYLDNRIVASIPAELDGGWRGSVEQVEAGIYTLRVDEVNFAGEVTSRLETPFKREEPAILAAATDSNGGPVTAVTVQTGDTLWAIARDRYGEGLLYVRVFEANRGAIRDPDLIYPGQIFDLPGD